jgi:hypothetical protein
MGWKSLEKRVAVVVASAAASSMLLGSLSVAPAAAAVPAAQSTTAFCVNVPADAGGFTDIASSIHRRTIQCLAYAQVTFGKTATTFVPGGVVTRGEMASFIARAIDKANELERVALPSLPDAPPDKFTDDETSVHEANIDRLAAAGIVRGTSATSFSPLAPVTRGQMATFINNAQKFLSGGTPFTTSSDYFVDDETSVHEANINGIASAGITAGVDATHYAPQSPVLRGNMASFITRYLAVLHKFGVIDALPAPTNATLTFTPTAPLRVTAVTEPSTADDRVYTATGLTGSSYRVTLVQSSLVTKPGGQYTFTEDGTTNLAAAGTVGGQIVAVNGQTVPAAQSVGAIAPVNGQLTITVDAVDYSKLLPVIYTDQGGENTRLNLDAQNRPTEPFGVGGEMETIPVRATTGPIGQDATVVLADEGADLIVAGEGASQRSYLYDTNDDFYRGSIADANKINLAQFEAALSAGDRLDGTTTYQSTAGLKSVFVLENVSPPPPTATLETPVGETTAVVTIDDLITGATAKVYLAADGAAFSAATLKATSATDADAAKTGFQVNLTGLTPGTSYEYYVTQVVAGEESEPANTVAGPGTSLVTAAVAAPTAVSVTGRPGSVLDFNFSEAVTPRTGAAPKFTVACGLLGVIPSFNATGTSVLVVDADTLRIGFNGSLPAADGGLTVCTASIAAGAVQDGSSTPNAAHTVNVP